TLYTPSCRFYKGLNAVPQAVPVSTCQWIRSQTGCGTNILAAVGQESIVLEAVVLWGGRATLPLVAASFSPKSAERPRHSCRGWIGVGRAGLNAQEPNKT